MLRFFTPMKLPLLGAFGNRSHNGTKMTNKSMTESIKPVKALNLSNGLGWWPLLYCLHFFLNNLNSFSTNYESKKYDTLGQECALLKVDV